MGVLDGLGIPPLVNAAGTFSRLGSPRVDAAAVEAMAEVSGVFLDLTEFQRAVNRRIAELLAVEAAFVCAGATAGIYLSTLACLARDDGSLSPAAFRDGLEDLPRRRVIIQGAQRSVYDAWIRIAGGELVEVGGTPETNRARFRAALSDGTAAVLYMAGAHFRRGALPLSDVIAEAHAVGVRVIVDAAAQLPPAANLRAFVAAGADLVVFSGGKALRAPGGSGLIVGRADLVRAIEGHATPHNRLGRAMKVVKEDLAGFLVAIERFLERDEAADRARAEATVELWITGLRDELGLTVTREFPGEAGKPVPRLRVEFDAFIPGGAAAIAARLLSGSPPVAVDVRAERLLYLNPETIDDERESNIVLTAMRQAIWDLRT